MQQYPSFTNSFNESDLILKKSKQQAAVACSKEDEVVDEEDMESFNDIKSKKSAYYDKRRISRKSRQKVRLTDPVKFVDLNFVMNYEQYFKPSIDPKLQLNVKGPLAYLFFRFEANMAYIPEIEDTDERDQELIPPHEETDPTRDEIPEK